MRKIYTALSCVLLTTFSFYAIKYISKLPSTIVTVNEDEENERYDGPSQRDSIERVKTIDPNVGYVPYDRLYDAINYTQALKAQLPIARLQQTVSWE
ncbi:MAG: hypothetical protein C4329_04335 [Chitinophagaceae bacterium]